MKKKNTKIESTVYRQGDVLVVRVDKIPAGLVKTKAITLALGEVTGHHHSITSEDCIGYALSEDALASYIEVNGAVGVLTHQEHSAIGLPTGKYMAVRQVEYTPEAIRPVGD